MPFFTYHCKGNASTNNGPHKTVVFVPATALGSNTPGGGGGNPAGGVNPATAGAAQAIITCPRCSFTAQPGDGNMSSVANGLDYMHQEKAVVNSAQAPTAAPANSPVALAIPGADSGIRIPINSPGNVSGLNSQALGIAILRLDSAGFKALL